MSRDGKRIGFSARRRRPHWRPEIDDALWDELEQRLAFSLSSEHRNHIAGLIAGMLAHRALEAQAPLLAEAKTALAKFTQAISRAAEPFGRDPPSELHQVLGGLIDRHMNATLELSDSNAIELGDVLDAIRSACKAVEDEFEREKYVIRKSGDPSVWDYFAGLLAEKLSSAARKYIGLPSESMVQAIQAIHSRLGQIYPREPSESGFLPHDFSNDQSDDAVRKALARAATRLKRQGTD